MEKSRLEKVKDEAKSKVSEELFSYTEDVLNRLKLSSHVEVKVWEDFIKDPDGCSFARQINKDKYEKFLEGVELDIEKRGKEAIKDIIDNITDVSEPRIKKILQSHSDLLREVYFEMHSDKK